MYLIYFRQTSAAHNSSNFSASFLINFDFNMADPESIKCSICLRMFSLAAALFDLVLWSGRGWWTFAMLRRKEEPAILMTRPWAEEAVGSKCRQSSQRNLRIGMRFVSRWSPDSQYSRHLGKTSYKGQQGTTDNKSTISLIVKQFQLPHARLTALFPLSLPLHLSSPPHSLNTLNNSFFTAYGFKSRVLLSQLLEESQHDLNLFRIGTSAIVAHSHQQLNEVGVALRYIRTDQDEWGH